MVQEKTHKVVKVNNLVNKVKVVKVSNLVKDKVNKVKDKAVVLNNHAQTVMVVDKVKLIALVSLHTGPMVKILKMMVGH